MTFITTPQNWPAQGTAEPPQPGGWRIPCVNIWLWTHIALAKDWEAAMENAGSGNPGLASVDKESASEPTAPDTLCSMTLPLPLPRA